MLNTHWGEFIECREELYAQLNVFCCDIGVNQIQIGRHLSHEIHRFDIVGLLSKVILVMQAQILSH